MTSTALAIFLKPFGAVVLLTPAFFLARYIDQRMKPSRLKSLLFKRIS